MLNHPVNCYKALQKGIPIWKERQQLILKIFIKTSKDTETIRKWKKKQNKRS